MGFFTTALNAKLHVLLDGVGGGGGGDNHSVSGSDPIPVCAQVAYAAAERDWRDCSERRKWTKILFPAINGSIEIESLFLNIENSFCHSSFSSPFPLL